jgi:hypothetical protein
VFLAGPVIRTIFIWQISGRRISIERRAGTSGSFPDLEVSSKQGPASKQEMQETIPHMQSGKTAGPQIPEKEPPAAK